MKIKRSHFWYNQRQRNGILLLAAIIIILQFTLFFVDFSSNETVDLNTPEIKKFEREMDSLSALALESRIPKIFPFNPSFITDHKGYQLGMSTHEIDRLFAYRSKGKYINSIQEFQRVTGVSDSLLQVIAPYFKFPDWIKHRHKDKSNKRTNISSYITLDDPVEVKDLNLATAKDFRAIPGIGNVLSQRIIKYRSRLGGFLINDQVFEVYGLDKEIAQNLLAHFQVLNPPDIDKININEASFKEVLSIAYLDYELTKKIFNYRDEVAEFQSLDELKQIDGFPLEKFDRIALYLQAK